MSEEKLIFGFDVGTGSLGLAVREGNDIVTAESLLLDAEVGELKEERNRRRQWVTRNAKIEREKWWEKVWKDAGKTPLYSRRIGEKNELILGDERLEREFPKIGDETCYNSALLRIMLMEGEPMEDWQIYKAVRSSFQRRGYDSNVPWAKSLRGDNKEEKETGESINSFKKELIEMTSDENYHLPAYYDVWKMNLWDPQQKKVISSRLDHKRKNKQGIKRARGYTAPREMVEEEVRRLLVEVGKRIPSLAGKENYILHGEKEKPYAFFNKREGVMGQKVPRFDNRVVGSCCCIPRFKACRANKLLFLEVSFLLQLKNLSYDRESGRHKLKIEEVKELYKKAKNKLREKIKKEADSSRDLGEKVSKISDGKVTSCFKLTTKEWSKWLEEKGLGRPNHYNEVKEPKVSGRCRYSLVALKIIKDLILSGQSPLVFYKDLKERLGNEKFKTKLTEEDISFLKRMGDEWTNIYIPALDLAKKYQVVDSGKESLKDRNIMKVIGSCHNPLVRHRLVFFYQEFVKLVKKYGVPDKVMIELVREDFMGLKAKKRYEKFREDKETKYKNVLEKYKEINPNREVLKNGKKKLGLLKDQNNKCPYTGDGLIESDLNSYDIDHILPEAQGGERLFENLCLTKRETNQLKKNRLPFDFIREKKEWEAFKKRVEGMYGKKEPTKMRVMLSSSKEEAIEHLGRRKALNETSEVATFARNIVSIYLGWNPGEKSSEKKVEVISGGLTAKVRRRNGLDKLLGGEKDGAKNEQKDRGDKRHHALDAMVICYLSEWYRSNRTKDFFKFPKSMKNPNQYFKEKLSKILPRKKVYRKAALGETIYRKIKDVEEGEILVVRKLLVEYLGLTVNKEQDWRKNALKKINKIVDSQIRQAVKNALEEELSGKTREQAVDYFVNNFYQNNNPEAPRILKVTTKASNTGIARDLKKGSHSERGQYFIDKSVLGVGSFTHGAFILKEGDKGYTIRTLHAFESPYKVKIELLRDGYEIWEDEIIRREMIVGIKKPFKISKEEIPVGRYIIKNFTGNKTQIKSIDGSNMYGPVSVNRVIVEGEAYLVR